MFYPLPVKKEEQKPEDAGRLVNGIDHLINFRKPEYDQSSAIVPCIYSCLYCGVTGNILYYTNDCFQSVGNQKKAYAKQKPGPDDLPFHSGLPKSKDPRLGNISKGYLPDF